MAWRGCQGICIILTSLHLSLCHLPCVQAPVKPNTAFPVISPDRFLVEKAVQARVLNHCFELLLSHSISHICRMYTLLNLIPFLLNLSLPGSQPSQNHTEKMLFPLLC